MNDENPRDCWGTPLWLVRMMEARLGGPFDLDVAADRHNTRAPRYFTREMDALAPGRSWACDRGFCNSPFSGGQQSRFAARVIQAVTSGEARIGFGVVTLGDPSTSYWAALEDAGAERIRLKGRWGCEPPMGIASSTAKATMVPWILRRTLTVREAIQIFGGGHVMQQRNATATVNDCAAVPADTTRASRGAG